MKQILILLFTLLFSNCVTAQINSLSPALDEAFILLGDITGSKVRNYSTRNFGRDHFNGAISVLVAETKAEELLYKIRPKLGKGLVAFIGTTNSLTDPKAIGVELVIGEGSGPLDIVKIAETDAVNYNMVTKDLLKNLGQWHRTYGIDIWQAETDTIQLKFIHPPKNTKSFAREVYKFCPDIVDQGVGSVEALEKSIRESRSLILWWD